MVTISVNFQEDTLANLFARWLYEAGEQQFIEWLNLVERNAEKTSGVVFCYHSIDTKYPQGDARRYGGFMDGNTITVTRP